MTVRAIDTDVLKETFKEKCKECDNCLACMFSVIDNTPSVITSDIFPRFNRGELEKVLDYWYSHLEVGNDEQNEMVWCAINTIKYCIESSSAYQE